ncbi:MAG: hypothetical protein K1X88_19790 [Nannocystaceae bacterium]|nr:hypothetical protein [Nannocystaceae bacterium]
MPSLLDSFRAAARTGDRAHRALLDAAATLSAPARADGHPRSIDGTFAAGLAADRAWLSRLRHSGQDLAVLEEADLTYGVLTTAPAIASLRADRIATDQVLVALIDELDDTVLGATVRWDDEPGGARTAPLWLCLAQLFEAQSRTRGRLALLLEQHGAQLGTLELIALAR